MPRSLHCRARGTQPGRGLETRPPLSLGGVRTEAPWGAGGRGSGQEGRCTVTCCCHGRDMERCGCNRTDTLAQRRSGRTSRGTQRRLPTVTPQSPSGDGSSQEASPCPHAEGPGGLRGSPSGPWGSGNPGGPCSPAPCLALAMGPAQGQVSRTPHTIKGIPVRGQRLGTLFAHISMLPKSWPRPFGHCGRHEQKRHHLKTGFHVMNYLPAGNGCYASLSTHSRLLACWGPCSACQPTWEGGADWGSTLL